MLFEGIFTFCITHQLRIRAGRHQPRQTAGMIGLGMVADHIINFFQFNARLDPLDQLIDIRRLNGIDHRIFFIFNQIGIIGRAALGFISVEIANGPVDVADPVNSFSQFGIHSVCFPQLDSCASCASVVVSK